METRSGFQGKPRRVHGAEGADCQRRAAPRGPAMPPANGRADRPDEVRVQRARLRRAAGQLSEVRAGAMPMLQRRGPRLDGRHRQATERQVREVAAND